MDKEQYKTLWGRQAANPTVVYRALWIDLLNASGWAGVTKEGTIVDRRYFPDALPVPANSLFGIPEPKDVPSLHEEVTPKIIRGVQGKITLLNPDGTIQMYRGYIISINFTPKAAKVEIHNNRTRKFVHSLVIVNEDDLTENINKEVIEYIDNFIKERL